MTKPDDKAGPEIDLGRIDELLALMKRLRGPDGCPWDREQNFATIALYTIEEAYEVADAIERDDMAALKDELGDLLFQVVFHSQMADEAGAFAFADVVDAIQDKMVRRHPHVFGEAGRRTATQQATDWERIKAAERAARPAASKSILADVPRALPALLRATKLQKRVARVGFDWPDAEHVFAKLDEEVGELRSAIADGAPSADVESELGDILFVVANLALKLGHDPEKALASTNAKFIRRFSRVEELLEEKGKNPEQSNLSEMDGLWDKAKREGF